MRRLPGFRRLFRLPSSAATVEAEVTDELDFHLESRVDELMRVGFTRAQARGQAIGEFGDVSDARSELTRIDRSRVRQRRRADLGDALRQDVRLALRALRHEPGFSAAVVLTLALGIGLNAAMFSITDRLMLRAPAHIVAPEQVKRLYFERTVPGRGLIHERAITYLDYRALRNVKAFQSLGAYFDTDGTLGRGQDAMEIRWSLATASLFPTLGVLPHIGRFFTEAEDQPGAAEPVVVLSYAFWQRHFGGERSALGRTLDLGRKKYTIVGVTPKGFSALDLQAVDVYVPLALVGAESYGDDFDKTRGMDWLRIVARLRAGSTTEEADAQATAIYRVENRDSTTSVRASSIILAQNSADFGNNAASTGRISVWLSGVSLIVLVIACANVMNLLLARVARRNREVGIRMALGVSRARLTAHFLIETMLFALLGGIGGLVIARWGGALVRMVLLPDIDWSGSSIDARTLAYGGALVVVCGFVAALAPAIYSLRTNVTAALKSGAREGSVRSRARTGLVLLQATLSVVLLVGSGLFVRSLLNVRNLHKGFDATQVVAITWDLDVPGYSGVEADRFYREAAERARTVPSVQRASVTVTVPFWSAIRTQLKAEGVDSIPDAELPFYSGVLPGYFETMGTRITRGRSFRAGEGKPGRRAAVIDEKMARRFWPNQNPLGKCLYIHGGFDDQSCTPIVGVAENVLNGSLDGGMMQYYLPLDHFRPTGFRALLVRIGDDRMSALTQLRRTLQSLRPGLPAPRMRFLGDLMAPQIRPWRMGASLFSAFGLLALVLAAIGLYSIIAYNVTQRTQEMSVRIALGASARHVVRLVVGEATMVVLAGMLIGLAGAVYGALKLAPLLFHVSPHDPAVFGGVAGVLLITALGAGLVPALRALRIQPIRALRSE